MPVINNLSLSSLRKYDPNKVISGVVNLVEPTESWLYDDGIGDQWWQGAFGKPCKWVITADVVASNHGSHTTRAPFIYNGLDITPGMWVMAMGDSRAVRILSIINATESTVQCLVEDVDRYNTFTDKTGYGDGIFPYPRDILFFELGEDGSPILDPLPDVVDYSSVLQVTSRFKSFGSSVSRRFFQKNHGFVEGQILTVSGGQLAPATSGSPYVVGTVTAAGPGPNYFFMTPSTKFIQDLFPPLPGSAGDLVYLDDMTGDLTTTPTSSPVYVKLTNAVTSYVIGTVANPSTSDGTSIKLNNEQITFTGPVIDASVIMTEINSKSATTGVVASFGSPPTIVVGANAYPTSTPASGLEFMLNGVTISVNTPSVNFGTSGDIGWWDVIRGVNELTDLHGVYASFDTNTGFVSFKNESGGPVDFTDVTPGGTIGGDKTFTDMIGVGAFNSPAPAEYLKLERADGGPIIVTNLTGSFTYDVGISSSQNGKTPIAVVVDKTMAQSTNYMVPDIASRDALVGVRNGDQVYVNSSDDGEWALFVKTSIGWTKIADQDSATTDADSLSATVSVGTASPVALGNISDGSRVVDVTISIINPFNDPGVTISVGITGQPEAIAVAANVDPTILGSYETSTSFVNNTGNEQTIFAFVNTGSATVGQAKIIVSYL